MVPWKSSVQSLNFALFCVYSYIREKEMEEEVLMQRREEEGKGRERRKALLEKEERKWKELEISLLSSIPNAGSRDAAAMAAAVRAVGGDSALEDSFARDRVSSIARHIRKAQLARRAEQVMFPTFHYTCISHNWG
jgi:transposase